MTKIEISPVTASLYHRYPRQTSPQDCYIELDCRTGALSADWDGEIGSAMPVDVWHGHRQRWGIPALRPDAANALIAEIAPLAQRVCDGYEEHWDGSNHVARFDTDAQEAIDAIDTLCERAGEEPTEQVQVWDASDWLGGIGDRDAQRRSLGITAATTDAQLAEIEARLVDEAHGEDVDEIDGLDRYLASLRDEARDELLAAVDAASAHADFGELRAHVRAAWERGETDAAVIAEAYDAMIAAREDDTRAGH
jgi:hypothetical protein